MRDRKATVRVWSGCLLVTWPAKALEDSRQQCSSSGGNTAFGPSKAHSAKLMSLAAACRVPAARHRHGDGNGLVGHEDALHACHDERLRRSKASPMLPPIMRANLSRKAVDERAALRN
jgi:hypothetical protein